jgi:hypothetical protein
MFRRVLYVVILVAAFVAAWFKGGVYLHEVHLGQARTLTGFLDLGYLLAMVVLALIAVRVVLRRRSPPRVPQSHADRTRAADISRGVSVQRIRITVREVFSTKPIAASVLMLFLISIPICLAALSVGGLKELSLGNWIFVGIAELPIAIVVMIALFEGAPSRQ